MQWSGHRHPSLRDARAGRATSEVVWIKKSQFTYHSAPINLTVDERITFPRRERMAQHALEWSVLDRKRRMLLPAIVCFMVAATVTGGSLAYTQQFCMCGPGHGFPMPMTRPSHGPEKPQATPEFHPTGLIVNLIFWNGFVIVGIYPFWSDGIPSRVFWKKL